MSLIVKIWSTIFESLFESTNINVVWGDTANVGFKVDLRLCLRVDRKYYDISNIEFKKHENNNRLATTDSSKVLVEAKAILNQILRHHNLDLEEAKKKMIINGQICGKFNISRSLHRSFTMHMAFYRSKSSIS